MKWGFMIFFRKLLAYKCKISVGSNYFLRMKLELMNDFQHYLQHI